MSSDRHTDVRFRTHGQLDPRVTLVLRDLATDRTVRLPMQPRGNGHWELTLPLRDGAYLARYYVGDDERTTYAGPAPAADRPSLKTRGLDALVTVGELKPAAEIEERAYCDQASRLRAMFGVGTAA